MRPELTNTIQTANFSDIDAKSTIFVDHLFSYKFKDDFYRTHVKICFRDHFYNNYKRKLNDLRRIKVMLGELSFGDTRGFYDYRSSHLPYSVDSTIRDEFKQCTTTESKEAFLLNLESEYSTDIKSQETKIASVGRKPRSTFIEYSIEKLDGGEWVELIKNKEDHKEFSFEKRVFNFNDRISFFELEKIKKEAIQCSFNFLKIHTNLYRPAYF